MSFYCLTHNANPHRASTSIAIQINLNSVKTQIDQNISPPVLFAGHGTKAHCMY